MRQLSVGLALALAITLAQPAFAANEISTDVTVDLAGTLAADEDVVEDAGGGAVTKINLGTLPAEADLGGYSIAPGGDILLSLDIAASLPGGVDVTPRDVVRWNGSVYTVELVGADHAMPAGAKIDAIGWIEGDLLLSFDVTVTLGNVTADDEDLVQLASTQPDDWVLYFDGSAAGVPAGADLDGADLLDASGHLALSFDISGTVGGVAFDDEDILDYAPSGGSWSMRYDGSAAHPELAAADVDAVFAPEPGAMALALAALATLAARSTRRRRVPRGFVAALAFVAAANPASAGDGRLEINQACVAMGCFPGDTPGFPVTTQADRSYLLTSSLALPSADSIGVTLASGSTLDLGGFSIIGPVTCTGDPPVCSAGTGVGVYSPNAVNVTIRNGTIRGTGNWGVRAGSGTRLEKLVIEQNALDGVIADFGPRGWLISECILQRNGRHGLNFAYAGGAEGSVVRNSVIRSNGSVGAAGSFSLIEGNAVTVNGSLGLSINLDGGDTAFSGNQITGNNGGSANPQTNGGIQTGINVCGTDTVCP